jgi:ribosomal protein S18 acetylase RimI-like enzyme
MTAVRVRAGRASDARAILELEQLFPSDRLSPTSVRRFLAAGSARVLVAEHADAMLGNLVLLLRAGSRKARIYSVIVSPAARGMGIGSRLVGAAERAARACGRETVSLEVRADNAAARAMYARRGYVVEREIPGYYDDGADGLRLAKALRPRRRD